jgi:hypothetical protein
VYSQHHRRDDLRAVFRVTPSSATNELARVHHLARLQRLVLSNTSSDASPHHHTRCTCTATAHGAGWVACLATDWVGDHVLCGRIDAAARAHPPGSASKRRRSRALHAAARVHHDRIGELYVWGSSPASVPRKDARASSVGTSFRRGARDRPGGRGRAPGHACCCMRPQVRGRRGSHGNPRQFLAFYARGRRAGRGDERHGLLPLPGPRWRLAGIAPCMHARTHTGSSSGGGGCCCC